MEIPAEDKAQGREGGHRLQLEHMRQMTGIGPNMMERCCWMGDVRDVEHHAVEPIDVGGAVSGDLGRVRLAGELLGDPEPREDVGPELLVAHAGDLGPQEVPVVRRVAAVGDRAEGDAGEGVLPSLHLRQWGPVM